MPTETFTLRSPMPASAEDVYAWHARPGAFPRLIPPWERIVVASQKGAFGTDGMRVAFRAKSLGPFDGSWAVELYDFQPGRQFQYRQVEGPFPFWNHTHRFIPDGPDRSFLENHIEYRLPLGPFGRLMFRRGVKQRLATMFAYRHAVTASELWRHMTYRDRPRLKVAITGSRGFIGSDLALFLVTGGHSVVRLVSGSVQQPPFDDGTTAIPWEPQAPIDPATLAGCDAVVHLAGDNIASGRWTEAKRKRITESRTVPTKHIADAIAALPHDQRPKVFVCASGAGFYGDRGDEELTEESSAGSGFLVDVCQQWEDMTTPAAVAGVRVVNLRTGMVLSPKGGALGKQLLAFQAGAGAVLGSGKQWVSWITLNDMVGAIHHCLMTESIRGPVNHVGPRPVTNRDFTKALGRALGRPAFLWLPRWALRVMFGELTDAALLASTRALPRKLLDSGFTFDHVELESALRFLLGK